MKPTLVAIVALDGRDDARALELDSQFAAGHTAVAYATLHFDWDADRACRQFDNTN